MPNRRLPRSAKTLIAQMEQKYKTVKAEPVADSADGLNVMRQVKFSPKAPAEYLHRALKSLLDPRVESVKSTSGVLTVTFSADRIADDTTSFALDEAIEVADDEDSADV